MKKQTQRVFAGVLAVLISVAMIGSAIIGYYVSGNGSTANPSTSSKTSNAAADYQAQKSRIEAMVNQAKVDPSNGQLQSALGNEYYDAGVTAQSVAPSEAQDNFKHAVDAYQNALKTQKNDVNILVDMATAAYYSGDNQLAENSYKEALTLKPDFINGLINYGFFLSQAKQDWAGALIQWQKALPLAQSSSDKEQVQAMINQAQSQLKSTGNNGLSNPALNGAANATTGK